MNNKLLIKRLKAIEATAKLLLEDATAIRKELESSGVLSNSPEKGFKNDKAVATVLSKRRANISNKK